MTHRTKRPRRLRLAAGLVVVLGSALAAGTLPAHADPAPRGSAYLVTIVSPSSKHFVGVGYDITGTVWGYSQKLIVPTTLPFTLKLAC